MMQRKSVKKILFICTNVDIGGGEVQLIYLTKELKKRGFDILILLPGKGQVSSCLDDNGIKYQIMDPILFIKKKWYFVFPVKGIFKLLEIIKTYNPDIVHLSHYQAVKIGSLVARLLGVPNIWTCHGFWYSPKGIRGIYINALLDKIVTVSMYAKKGILKNGKIKENKIEIINNGVPEYYFKVKKQGDKFKEEQKIPKNKIIIGTIARLEKLKRHDFFIDVLYKLIIQNYPVCGIIIGSEQLSDHRENIGKTILEQINKLDITKHIVLIPYQKDPIPAYDAVDILLITSDKEAFSNAVIEGMARSKAVISTACGGPQEIINDGENGYLVALNEKEKMADRIAWLIENPEQRILMGEKAKEYVYNNYHVNKMVDKYVTLYNRM